MWVSHATALPFKNSDLTNCWDVSPTVGLALMWHIPAKLSCAQSRRAVTKNGCNVHDCVKVRRGFSQLSFMYVLFSFNIFFITHFRVVLSFQPPLEHNTNASTFASNSGHFISNWSSGSNYTPWGFLSAHTYSGVDLVAVYHIFSPPTINLHSLFWPLKPVRNLQVPAVPWWYPNGELRTRWHHNRMRNSDSLPSMELDSMQNRTRLHVSKGILHEDIELERQRATLPYWSFDREGSWSLPIHKFHCHKESVPNAYSSTEFLFESYNFHN